MKGRLNEMNSKLERGKLWALSWYNLTITDNVDEKTLLNRRKFEHNTTGYIHVMDNPAPSKSALLWIHEVHVNIESVVHEGDYRPGLLVELIINPNPDNESLRTENFTFDNSIAEYWPTTFAAHIKTIYDKYYGKEVLGAYEKGGGVLSKPIERACLFKIEPHRSDIHLLKIM